MYYTDDPLKDFDRYEAEQQRYLDSLPKCAECGEPIQSEKCYEIDGELICQDCLENNHMHWVEDYID